MTPGYVKPLVAFPAFAVDARKRSKAEPIKVQGIGMSVLKRTFDPSPRLFYAAGIIPSDGGAKQLSQRGLKPARAAMLRTFSGEGAVRAKTFS